MMKRVCNSRFAMCALLLAVFLLVSGAGAPVCARENISAGQAGDPGDGLDVISGGSNGSTVDDGGSNTQGTDSSPQQVGTHTAALLIPYYDGHCLRFIILFDLHRFVERLK